MTHSVNAKEFQARLARLDALIRDAERLDPAARTCVQGMMQAVLDLHGAALEQLLGHLEQAGEPGRAILDACAQDEVVSGLLLLHGLHPLDLEARVWQALEGVRPYLRSHGGNVELLGVRDGLVRLRLHGSCDGCPSSAVTMRQTIEEAIYTKAPDVTGVEVEGLAVPPTVPAVGPERVALPLV
jgi:Fe-S cluster biogenesis protein NfuA